MRRLPAQWPRSRPWTRWRQAASLPGQADAGPEARRVAQGTNPAAKPLRHFWGDVAAQAGAGRGLGGHLAARRRPPPAALPTSAPPSAPPSSVPPARPRRRRFRCWVRHRQRTARFHLAAGGDAGRRQSLGPADGDDDRRDDASRPVGADAAATTQHRRAGARRPLTRRARFPRPPRRGTLQRQ